MFRHPSDFGCFVNKLIKAGCEEACGDTSCVRIFRTHVEVTKDQGESLNFLI